MILKMGRVEKMAERRETQRIEEKTARGVT